MGPKTHTHKKNDFLGNGLNGFDQISWEVSP
jgi:hypothetical protein